MAETRAPKDRDTNSLTALLRAGDPAAGDTGLSPDERSALRRRVLAVRREGGARPSGWLVPATTVVALLALALGMAWRGPGETPRRLVETATGPGLGQATGEAQQVQFVTESGTLVVWVLQPRSTG